MVDLKLVNEDDFDPIYVYKADFTSQGRGYSNIYVFETSRTGNKDIELFMGSTPHLDLPKLTPAIRKTANALAKSIENGYRPIITIPPADMKKVRQPLDNSNLDLIFAELQELGVFPRLRLAA
jgi:hypothetical protein